MKLNTNSNVYTIVYASVMVIIVAFLLAFISSSLKSRQDDNEANDKRSQILASLNLRDVQDVQEEFKTVVVKDIVVNVKGEVIKENGGFDVESKKITAKNDAEKELPVYVCKVDNQELYVLPLYGRGLWGGLWGYLALKPDFKTVYGCFLSHEGETAGLGARIVEPDFQKKFIDKVVFADDNFAEVALGVKKKVDNPASQVDAITGATLTSNGVDEMFRTSLAPYKQYFLNMQGGASCGSADVKCSEKTCENCSKATCKECCKESCDKCCKQGCEKSCEKPCEKSCEKKENNTNK